MSDAPSEPSGPSDQSGPWDPGLQPERTLLSWRRTCLALALASVVVVRFTVWEFGVVGLAFGGVGVLLAVAAYLAATTRYRRAHDDLSGDAPLSTDAVPLALMTATIVVLGLACAVYVVAQGTIG